MKLILVAILAALTVGCSAFSDTPNRRIERECVGCYHYSNGPQDTMSQTMRGGAQGHAGFGGPF